MLLTGTSRKVNLLSSCISFQVYYILSPILVFRLIPKSTWNIIACRRLSVVSEFTCIDLTHNFLILFLTFSFQSLLSAVVHNRPDNPVEFLQECLEVAKQNEDLRWNSFLHVQDKTKKNSQTTQTGQFDKVFDTELDATSNGWKDSPSVISIMLESEIAHCFCYISFLYSLYNIYFFGIVQQCLI